MKSVSDYTKLLNQLKDSQINSILIGPDDFANFQAAFMEFPTRKRIVGSAKLNGQITYTYDRN